MSKPHAAKSNPHDPANPTKLYLDENGVYIYAIKDEWGNLIPPKEENQMENELEQLAAAEHDSWASWMNWLYQNGTWSDDGSFTINPDKAKRWFQLSITRYEELDEPTKQFDRDEVKKIKPLLDVAFNAGIEAALGALPEKLMSHSVPLGMPESMVQRNSGHDEAIDQAKSAIEGLKKK